jgi:hypothetical protein
MMHVRPGQDGAYSTGCPSVADSPTTSMERVTDHCMGVAAKWLI